MKHFIPVLVCLLLISALCVPAFASEVALATDPTVASAATEATEVTEPFADVPSGVDAIPGFNGVYPMAYSMLRYYLYADFPLTSSMELTLTFCATIIALFVIVLPVAVVFVIIRFLVGV